MNTLDYDQRPTRWSYSLQYPTTVVNKVSELPNKIHLKLLILATFIMLSSAFRSLAANGCEVWMDVASWACCGGDNASSSLLADGQQTATANIHTRGCLTVPSSVTWALVGNARGCTIEPVIDPENSNAPSLHATITAGKQNGPITIRATVSYHCGDVPEYDATVQLEAALELCGAPDEEGGESSCGSCSGSGLSDGSDPRGRKSAGTAIVLNNFGPDFSLSLGREDFAAHSGTLHFSTQAPAQATPAMLDLPYYRSKVTRIPATGSIQQVKMPEGLVTVETVDSHQFDIRVYYNSQVAGPVNGYYVTQGDPFVRWNIANPGQNTSQLRISEFRGTSLMREFYFGYNATLSQWTETDLDDLRTVVRWKETDAQGRPHSHLEIKAGTEVVAKKHWIYETINSQQLLTVYEEGVSPNLRTTTYTYYTTGDNAGLVKSIDYPEGRWEYFCYDDSERRLTSKYETYLNSTRPVDGSTPDPTTCRLTEYAYALSETGDGVYDPGVEMSKEPRKITVKLLNHEVERSYNLLTFRSELSRLASQETRRCPTPPSGAGWASADNTRTVTWYCTNLAFPQFLGRVQAVLHEDGTSTRYEYELHEDGTLSQTEWRGQDDNVEPPTSLVTGTKSITEYDELGLVQQRTTIAIQNSSVGPILAQETFNYMQPSPSNTEYMDPLRRDHDITDLAGRITRFRYSCCALSHSVDPDGVTTYYDYDSLGRLYSTRQVVQTSPTENWIQTVMTLDAAGRVLVKKRIGTDGNTANAVLLEQAAYDVLGRLVYQTNGLSGVTTNLYLSNGNGLREVVLYPDGGTRTNDYYRDGTLQQTSGTAVFGVKYERDLVQDGESGPWREYSKQTKLRTDYTVSDEWTMTYADGAGQVYKTLYAPRQGIDSVSPYSQTWYNNCGQVWKQRDPDGLVTLFSFDGEGRPEYTIQALTSTARAISSYSALRTAITGETLFGGSDRIAQTRNYVLASGASGNSRGVDIRRTENFVWKDNESTGTLVSQLDIATDSLQTWQNVYPGGSSPAVTSHSATTLAGSGNGWTRTITQSAPDGSQNVTIYQYGRLQSSTRKDNTTSHNQVAQTTFGYDTHGRQSLVTDARNGATTYTFNAADLVASVTTPAPAMDQAAQTTVSWYNKSLQVTNVIQPDGTGVTNWYLPNGLRSLTGGSRSYPVGYTYDYAGRAITMTTWTNFGSASGAAITSWNYNPYRGWLDSKDYPDGTSGGVGTIGPDYTYTAGGRLKTRTWARTGTGGQRVVTTYKYGFDDAQSDNEHDGLVEVSYANDPQGTPSVTYAYDRLGRQKEITQSAMSTTCSYNQAGQLLTESYTGGTLSGLAVASGYDDYLRRASLDLLNGQSTLASTAYSYDAASRLQTVTDDTGSPTYSATYTYVANSLLPATVAFKQGTTEQMVTIRQYDFLNRLTAITSGTAAGTLVSSHAYTYNLANQRTRARLADASFWVYEYDRLGQVKSGKRYWSDWTPVAGQQFEYGFDDIGNRTGAKAGGDASGAGLRSTSYTANRLNQYTDRTVPGYLDVMGVALASSTVTVNTESPYRRGEYFRKELTVANNNGPVWQQVDVTASGESPVTRHAFVPQYAEAFMTDADGNLTQDGRWSYTWDAENRLVQIVKRFPATDLSSIPYPSAQNPTVFEKVTYEYDAQSRRIAKRYYTTAAGTTPFVVYRYVYDGWNLLAIVDAQSAVLQCFTWGLDLSGTLQGAGGIGGLLWDRDVASSSGYHAAAYDGNGNVTALVSLSASSVSARYEYGPCGEPLRQTGLLAEANPFHFSSRFTDTETGNLYYGSRYYVSSLGRWLNRDPIEEHGGENLYSAMRNDCVDAIDLLGLDTVALSYKMSGRSKDFTVRNADGSTSTSPGSSLTATITGNVTATCSPGAAGRIGDVTIGPFNGRLDSWLGNRFVFYFYMIAVTWRITEEHKFDFSTGAQVQRLRPGGCCTELIAPIKVRWWSDATLDISPNIPRIKVPFPSWINLFHEKYDLGHAEFRVRIECCRSWTTPVILLEQ